MVDWKVEDEDLEQDASTDDTKLYVENLALKKRVRALEENFEYVEEIKAKYEAALLCVECGKPTGSMDENERLVSQDGKPLELRHRKCFLPEGSAKTETNTDIEELKQSVEYWKKSDAEARHELVRLTGSAIVGHSTVVRDFLGESDEKPKIERELFSGEVVMIPAPKKCDHLRTKKTVSGVQCEDCKEWIVKN